MACFRVSAIEPVGADFVGVERTFGKEVDKVGSLGARGTTGIDIDGFFTSLPAGDFVLEGNRGDFSIGIIFLLCGTSTLSTALTMDRSTCSA
jgi:hypothetical protein